MSVLCSRYQTIDWLTNRQLKFWLSGGQEAIPYQNTESLLCTYSIQYTRVMNDDSYNVAMWIVFHWCVNKILVRYLILKVSGKVVLLHLYLNFHSVNTMHIK